MAIFANVGKGVLAKKEDLQAAFGTTDDRKICLEILAMGELQVGARRGPAAARRPAAGACSSACAPPARAEQAPGAGRLAAPAPRPPRHTTHTGSPAPACPAAHRRPAAAPHPTPPRPPGL
jgi:hypothetical protein